MSSVVISLCSCHSCYRVYDSLEVDSGNFKSCNCGSKKFTEIGKTHWSHKLLWFITSPKRVIKLYWRDICGKELV